MVRVLPLLINLTASGLVRTSSIKEPATKSAAWSHTGPPITAQISAIRAPPANHIVVSADVANSTSKRSAIAISQNCSILSDIHITSFTKDL